MMPTLRFPVFLIMSTMLVTVAVTSAQNSNQQPAGGGTTSEATGPKKTTTPRPLAATPKAPSKVVSKSAAGVAEKIDGKWWTSGNDFGKSAIVFTQLGNEVTGQITYADGRTGNLTGVFTGKRLNYSWSNSAGDRGTGWLEQSWTNFLGGPWRGQRVKDGSWTMNRIEGNWCFGGLRTRVRKVTHNAQGDLRYVTEDGEPGEGHLDGPYIFLEDEGLSVKGEMYYKANRINFATGTYWNWCGR
jgi:hypothetical protein